MNGYVRTETLTNNEAKLLSEQIKDMNTMLNYSLIIFPILFILATTSWYFNWSGIIKFICTGLCLAFLASLLVSYIKVRETRLDIKANKKIVGYFLLKKKAVMGYVRRHGETINSQMKKKDTIIVSDESVRGAIVYKTEQQRNSPLGVLMKSEAQEELLHNSYIFEATPIDQFEEITFEVPIEFYLTGKEGDTIVISYAQHSQRVFDVKELKR